MAVLHRFQVNHIFHSIALKNVLVIRSVLARANTVMWHKLKVRGTEIGRVLSLKVIFFAAANCVQVWTFCIFVRKGK